MRRSAGSAGDATGHAVALQPDGKIVVAGGEKGAGVARFTPAGLLDATYGGAAWPGVATFTAGTGYGVRLDASGRALVSLNADVVRLDGAGKGDGTFTRTTTGTRDAIAVTPDGRRFTAGTGLSS